MNVDDFVKGWLVGDFNPVLFNSDSVEVGLKYYKAGDYEQTHVHDVITEYTIVVYGSVRMKGSEFGPRSIIKIEPGESTDFLSIEDSATLVIKTPSIPSDKRVIQ